MSLKNFLTIHPEPREHVARESVAILTMGVGESERLLRATRNNFHLYAHKCHADYVEILGPPLYSMWQHDKFRYHDYMRKYERVLVIDCDVLIARNCPNIFDLVPEDSIGIRNDIMDVGDVSWWLESERRQVAASQHVEPEMFNTLYNTGVVVLSKQHYDVWRQPSYLLCQTHSSEQLWIERQIHTQSHKVFDLPKDLHCHAWTLNFESDAPHANIVHFSGVKDRLEAIARFKQANPRFDCE